MSVYITGIGAITPQGCFPSEDILKEMKVFKPGRMVVREPNYKDFISPIKLRRMSKIIKMGLASALMCLNDTHVEIPDAIITATGLGAVEDTDKFLDSLIDSKEALLNPTPFIQSTHNTVAGIIAIELSCRAYNMTYVHKNVAFEHALLDTILKINSGSFETILLAGMDEISEDNYNLKKHVGFWKENVNNANLLKYNNSTGTLAGEGSVVFSLSSKKTPGNYAEVRGTKTFYKIPSKPDNVLIEFLASVNLIPEDIDVVLLGKNGNVDEDFIYDSVIQNMFDKSTLCWYKHLCGEYETVSAFAMLLAANLLRSQVIPEYIKLTQITKKELKNVLIIQHRFNRNLSFTVLSK